MGVPKDERQGFLLYMRVAERGYPVAQYAVAEMLWDGIGISVNRAEALSWFLKSAEQQFAPAAYRLAAAYRDGIEVQRSDTEMFRWISCAANWGFPLAQYQLGKCHEYGIGTTKDTDTAIRWYLRAAENDCSVALRKLAQVYSDGALKTNIDQDLATHYSERADAVDERKITEERDRWIMASRHGDKAAQELLSGAYREGLMGLPQSDDLAAFWARKSHEVINDPHQEQSGAPNSPGE